MKTDAKSPSTTRQVARRTKRPRKAYLTSSLKSGSTELRLESQDELTVAQLLELDPRTSGAKAQSCTFDLTHGVIYDVMPESKVEGAQYYTPDLIDRIGGLLTVIEVKPERFCKANEELFEKVRDFCLKKGMRFVVVSKESFPPTLLKNIKVLHQFYRQFHDQLADLARVVDALPSKNGHIKDVMNGLSPASHYVVAGILYGIISVDLSRNFIVEMDFDVRPAYGDLSSLEIISYE